MFKTGEKHVTVSSHISAYWIDPRVDESSHEYRTIGLIYHQRMMGLVDDIGVILNSYLYH